jgi:adenylylsulfate kinase-like enzyme
MRHGDVTHKKMLSAIPGRFTYEGKRMGKRKSEREQGGLIWVSSYTSAGKSTVAREVREVLDKRGIASVLLDDDNLRAILGGVFGYQPEHRRELAKASMRISSNLSS